MTLEESRLNRRRRERITRVKRILRRMPRRSNVHRYPVLKWFAQAARKRSYLWSFRVRAVVPAFYTGGILALLPLYGIQLPFAVALAFVLRANLPILFSLQFITNPLTILPVYYTCFQVGKAVFIPFGLDTPQVNMGEMSALIKAVGSGNLVTNFSYIMEVWGTSAVGGIVLGTALASIAAGFYKLAAYEVSISYRRLRDLEKRPPAGTTRSHAPEPSERARHEAAP